MGKKILQIWLIVMLILLVGVLFIVSVSSRQSIVNLAMKLSSYPLEKYDVMDGLFTSLRLNVLKGVLLVVALIHVYCMYTLNGLYKFICKFCNYIYTAFKNVFLDLNTKEALSILIIPFASSIYFAATIPVSLDEGFTFVEFTNKPFFYCAIFYPYPNNHVLHTLLTNLTDSLPFLPTLFKLRLPALFSSILAWIIAFSFLKKYYSVKLATVVVGLASVGFMAVYYSFMARGYSMVMLFFVIALYASFNIIKLNRPKDWLFFVLASVLGCYAVPSFLYPLLTLHVFMLISNYKVVKNQIGFGFLAILLVAMCYMPIIVVDGLDALIGNNFVLPKGRGQVLAELPRYFGNTLYELFNLPILAVCLLMAFSIFVSVKKRNKQALLLYIIFLLMPFLLLVGHSVIPFPRTFNYYGFVIPFLIAIPFAQYIHLLNRQIVIVAIIGVQFLSMFYFGVNIGTYETFNTENKVVNNWVFEDNDPNNTYYIAGGHNVQNFIFELVTHGYNEKSAVLNWIDKPISADSLSSYNYVIVDSHIDSTHILKPVFTNQQQHVYKFK